jgi:hypothetical protein
MSGGFRVRIVEEILYAHQDLRKQTKRGYLFDGNGRFPAFIFVENGETYCP